MTTTVWVQNPATGRNREVTPEKAAMLALSGWPQVPPPGSGSTDPVDDVITRSEMVQYVAENGGGGGGGSTPDATTSTKGKAVLLGGTASAPTVPWNKVTDTPSAYPPADHTSARVTDFAEAAQDAVAAMLTQGTGVALTYNDAANTMTVTATGGGAGGLDAEAVRDAIGVAMVGVGNISVVVNDAADTITITTTATQNSTDAALRDRSTHTGQDPISAVAGLQAALDGKASATSVDASALTGVIADARIPDGIARDQEVATAVAAALVEIRGGTLPANLDQLVEIVNQLATDEASAAALAATVAQKAPRLTPTVPAKTSAYTAAAGDLVLVDATSGPVAVTIPAASAGASIAIKKIDNSANPVTVTLPDSSTVTLVLAGETRTLLATGSTWYVVGGLNTLSSLDGRYARLAEVVNTVAAAGAAQTLPDTATIHDLTLTAACTLTLPPLVAGRSFTLVLRQDSTGGRAVTWPSGVKWPSATPPTLSTAGLAVDDLTFMCPSGASWHGFLAGKDMR